MSRAAPRERARTWSACPSEPVPRSPALPRAAPSPRRMGSAPSCGRRAHRGCELPPGLDVQAGAHVVAVDGGRRSAFDDSSRTWSSKKRGPPPAQTIPSRGREHIDWESPQPGVRHRESLSTVTGCRGTVFFWGRSDSAGRGSSKLSGLRMVQQGRSAICVTRPMGGPSGPRAVSMITVAARLRSPAACRATVARAREQPARGCRDGRSSVPRPPTRGFRCRARAP